MPSRRMQGCPPPQDSWDPGSLDTVLLQHELPSPRSSSPAPGAPFRSPSLPWLVGSIHHARFSQCHILLRRRGCLASQEALPPQGWTRPRGLERPNLVIHFSESTAGGFFLLFRYYG